MAQVENGSNGSLEPPMYMAAQPKSSNPTKIEATFDALKQTTWQQLISMILVKILWKCYTPLKLVGLLTEWTINFLVLNNAPWGLLYNVLFFKWGNIVFPNPDADNYLSSVGQLDPRPTLFMDTSKAGIASSTRADALVFPAEGVGARSTADVCVMAAKLAYENPAVIQKVVKQNWKMHFVKFFNCWNAYQHMNNTQAFVFMDKPTDANAVVVAFRGTEAYNAYDWSTDLDFSWVKLDGLGGVHLGFLEALGLVNRDSIGTLAKLRTNIAINANTPPIITDQTEDSGVASKTTSGLPDQVIAEQLLAYDDITKKVATILQENPNAKLFITGHSLGGALASLYATMLHYTGATEVANKIGAVYTFGQPRVGDEDVAMYATEKLRGRLYRVVYCNDVVPRVPFDSTLFAFKHFGDCAYFNSVYDGLVLQEEPNRNFFGVGRLITMHLNAAWEVFQGLVLITLQHGQDFQESSSCLMFRMLGLVFPGISSHSPCNYVNAVRLGPFPLKERLKGDIADLAEEFHLMHDNIKDIIYVIFSALPALPGKDVWQLAAQNLLPASSITA